MRQLLSNVYHGDAMNLKHASAVISYRYDLLKCDINGDKTPIKRQVGAV